jgi:chromosome segregation ATPase
MLIEEFKERVAGFQVGDELKLEALCDEWNEELTDSDVEMFRDLLAEETERAEQLEIENAELREAQRDLAGALSRALENFNRLEKRNDELRDEIGLLENELRAADEEQTATEAELKRVEEALWQTKADLAEANQMVRTLIEEGK